MSLRDGTKKMSKSDPSDYSRINMTDDADTVALKIRRAKTDPLPLPDSVEGLSERPEAENLIDIYAALAGVGREAALAEFAGAQFSQFKERLADLAVSVLGPIGAEMKRLVAAPDHVDAILARGAARANAVAEPHLAEIYEHVGMLRPQHAR